MKVETNNLQTIGNYSKDMDITASYFYRLIREGKIKVIEIDGVKFIDKKKISAHK